MEAVGEFFRLFIFGKHRGWECLISIFLLLCFSAFSQPSDSACSLKKNRSKLFYGHWLWQEA